MKLLMKKLFKLEINREGVVGMALFDAVKEKLANAGKTAIKASNEIIEVTKLNLLVKSEEDKIKDRLLEIGKAVYEHYRDGKPVEAELSISCEEIAKCEKIIDELKQKIMEIKKLRECKACLAHIDDEALYCPKCGAKVE